MFQVKVLLMEPVNYNYNGTNKPKLLKRPSQQVREMSD